MPYWWRLGVLEHSILAFQSDGTTYNFPADTFRPLEIFSIILYNLLISNDRGGKDKMAKEGKEKKKGSCLKTVLIIVVVIVVIGVIGNIAGGNEESNTTDVAENASNTSEESSEPIEQTEEEQREYTATTVNDMMAALNANALNASDTYKDQYLEVTGTLGAIDSSGKYITLMPDDDFAIVGVQCYVTDDSQLDIVKTLSTDSTVTVCGKCTDVGEVIGYSLDIDEIVQ